MDKTEVMILEIKKNNVLYNKSNKYYKDITKKKNIWKAIGERVGLTGREAETRWKNVRDGYGKYRRKLKRQSGDACKKVKEYKYAKAMSFLAPHMGDRPTSSYLEEESGDEQDDNTDEEDNASQISDFHPQQDHPVRPSNPKVVSAGQSKLRQKTAKDDLDTALCQCLKNKSHSLLTTEEKQDDVDLFLQSMAGTVRKLPARKQAEVKFQIHSIVHEAEMQCFSPPMMTPFDMQSTDERPNSTCPSPDVKPMISQPTVSSSLESAFHSFQS